MTSGPGTHRTRIGSLEVDLPLVRVNDQLTIALLMTIDHGVSFIETAGGELAEALRDLRPEVVVSAATLGIPVALEVSRGLGLDDYVILQKTQKVHLGDALAEPVDSVTTDAAQTLLLDRARVDAVRGRRAVFVDDVLSTGSSAAASLRLLRRAGAAVVGAGFLLEEGDTGRAALAEYTDVVRSLGTIPVFTS
ncbi:hypothetical protein J4H86_18065 [Spiractinospora alimapuensis]|uniref:phosphoribosyltransferase family protein n=1 Tax=Spiractinospora alimapuensis TaxID=2820884 RepID=UPI001F430D98|nr:phosphoribosyltransferase family protein [Spiractinospora alimapuensis]QVQ50772.1 hypothetical protein J4H86_18065 [Spiractinospora alimapuensis]